MDGDPGGDGLASSLLLTRDGQRAGALVEVTVPVYNEEKVLADSVRRLHSYLTANVPFRFVITIADNASTDETFAIARRMCAELPGVRAIHLDRKGRGRALRHVWGSSTADVVSYMDADLHYVLIGGAGGIGGFGGGAAGTSSVNSWVEQNCAAVPASAYGGPAASSTTGGGTGGLYRCG